MQGRYDKIFPQFLMPRYWVENKQIQTRGFRVAKIFILGCFGMLICVFGAEALFEFVGILRNRPLVAQYCTTDCNFYLTMGLFFLLCVYDIGLLVGLIKAPKGFWLNFLLVFWGLSGLIFLQDAWQYSWQPKVYS